MTVITQGYGPSGTPSLVVTQGYLSGEETTFPPGGYPVAGAVYVPGCTAGTVYAGGAAAVGVYVPGVAAGRVL